jgi:conjugal transfer pilus assembly protein TraW
MKIFSFLGGMLVTVMAMAQDGLILIDEFTIEQERSQLSSDVVQNLHQHSKGDQDMDFQLAPRVSPELNREVLQALNAADNAPLDRLLKTIQSPQELNSNPGCSDGGGEGTWIFLSTSMTDHDVRQAIMDNPESSLVFRGVPEGSSIDFISRYLSRILGDVDLEKRLPTVSIDPRPFKRFGIHSVPAVAMANPEGIAKVFGIANEQWLKTKTNEDGYKDYGIQGQILEIAEIDFLQDIQKRLAKLDYEEMERQAKESFWRKAPSEVLPFAAEDATRFIDPTFTLNKPLYTSDGQLVAPAGRSFNPFDYGQLSKRYLIIDPTSEEEVSWALGQMAKAHEADQGVSIIATHLSSGEEAQMYNALMQRFGQRVFLLTKQIKQRFQIRFTPTLFQAQNRKIRVDEYALDRSFM